MVKKNLVNLTFVMPNDFDKPFTVSRYTFYPRNNRQEKNTDFSITTRKQWTQSNRKHTQNAYVKYNGKQNNSILFRGGRVGKNQHNSQKRKFIEDILIIISILTAQNTQLYSRRYFPQFPVVSRNHLEYISNNAKECKQHLEIAINKITDPDWQKQFENGFHLRMLLNHANILTTESRFLSMVVIWEWLYPHLKNPKGASSHDESNDLKEIFSFILKKYWPQYFNKALNKSNIFHVIRNQLAHSGKLPINRRYAQNWMKNITWENGLDKYLRFFDHLTQIVVLKTLGIDGENSLKVFNFPEKLTRYLRTGKI